MGILEIDNNYNYQFNKPVWIKSAISEHYILYGAITFAEKEKIEAALKDLEEVAKGSDKDAISAKTEELGKVSQKLGEKVYAAMAAKEQAAAGAPGDAAKPKDDNVVDADFKEVNDKK